LFGLVQLYAFQKQERPWRKALDRATVLALINLGLCPFLFFWHYVPGNLFFGAIVCLFGLSALLFLFFLNIVIVRLGAMLPDETLRLETRQYTALNRTLLIALLAIAGTYLLLTRVLSLYFPQIPRLPERVNLLSLQIAIPALGIEISSLWFVLLLTCILLLLPLSMTMALIWKTKEVIFENVFGISG
ncbi:MAG TPA: hypothetical protein PLH97_13210, partial [Verrucomicrobiota bacterium]|nr:hypothetical protein [Verrucomicrobiota bacterium]